MSDDIRTVVFKSEDLKDIEILAGHPNIYPGDSNMVKDGMYETNPSLKAQLTAYLMCDREEDSVPSDPMYVLYDPVGSNNKSLYERILQYDKNDRLLSSTVTIYEDKNPNIRIKAEYNPETEKRTKTTLSLFEAYGSDKKELIENRTEYDDLLVPRKRIELYIKDVEPVQDEHDKNLFFISGPKGFGLDRNYIVGPNENLLERYKQMVEHCNEIGLYPAYGNTSPAMNPDREYAIEMDGETFKIIRKDSDISPFKGDKIIIPSDDEKYFCDISTELNPLPFRPEAQMRLIEECPMNLFNIREPSREAQLLAVSKDPQVLEGRFCGEEEIYCKSPVDDKKILMEILRTDPSVVAYMEQQIDDLEDDDEFTDAVEEAKEETYNRFCRKDSVLVATDYNLLIYSEKGGRLPDDVTREELTRVCRACLDTTPYIVSPSGDGKTFDITNYYSERISEHSVTPSGVTDFLKKNMYIANIDDVRMLEGVRKTLKEKTEKVIEQHKNDLGK